jgi:Flp pilus assembly protein TadD
MSSNILGYHLQQAGQTQEAVPVLESSLKHHPNNAKTLYILGRAQLELGNFNGAAITFEKRVELDPSGKRSDADKVYAQLGAARMQQGDVHGAILAFRNCLSINPLVTPSVFLLGVSLMSINECDEAKQRLVQARERFVDEGNAVFVVKADQYIHGDTMWAENCKNVDKDEDVGLLAGMQAGRQIRNH